MRNRVRPSERLEYVTTADTAGEALTQSETMRRIAKNAVVGTLTPRQRDCVKMYYFDKMKLIDIATALDIDVSTVSRHLKAARVKLEKLQALL